jgi:hypothetical protein
LIVATGTRSRPYERTRDRAGDRETEDVFSTRRVVRARPMR